MEMSRPVPAQRAAAVFLLVCCPLLGCRDGLPPQPNIVLITIDTLRADHLTPYGHHRNTSPFLDQLTRESILFTDAISQCGTTPQSLSSMMTGLFPYTDEILRKNGPFAFLKRSNTSLAARLSAEGYRTHAITSSIQSAKVTGIDLGFESFDAITVSPIPKESRRRTAGEIRELARQWLDSAAQESRPFFLWLHFLDPHQPYAAPAEYQSRFKEDELREDGELRHYVFDAERSKSFPLTERRVRELVLDYDREIAFTDDALRGLFERGLRQVLDESIVIITADHGEALGEHGIIEHNELYHSILRVPLLIRLPKAAGGGRVVESPVMLVDLFPTILELANLPATPELRGISLASALQGDPHALDEPLQQRLRLAEYQIPALYQDGFKLIERATRPELYQLASDPGELHNLSGEFPDRRRAMLAEFEELRRRGPGAPVAGDAPLPDVTIEMQRELEALGYIDDR